MAIAWSGAHGLDAASAPDASSRSVVAVAIPAGGPAVRVDADLGDAIWSAAPAVTEFVQRDPSEGARASHETSLRVVFDHAALYVAIHLADPEADEVVGLLTRRDEASPSDWVRVMIDSYRDRRTAYEFAVNAAGVKQDRYWFNDTSTDASWDAVWDVATARDARGWRAEFRIPFSQLRFNPEAAGTFGFAVSRTVAHLNETSTWPLLARSASGYVSSFGELTGLAFSGSQKRLELAPYVLSQVATSPVSAGDPLRESPDPDATVGLDLRYKLAPGLTLTAAVNPDFGQVEADPAVVNLGAFETFFAERRPFFVEGSGNFSFGIDCSDGQCTGLFYSRRIGRSPQRVATAPDGGYALQPTDSTILGAAKITGRIAGFSVGVLHALTSREDARLADAAGGGITRSPVEPSTSYTVGRLSREFADQSRLSLMLTSTNRRLADELRFLPRTAVTGGVDADWRVGGAYSLTGFWAGSSVRGSETAMARLQRSNVHSFHRPDAGHVEFDPTRTSLAGHAGAINVNKISGTRTRFSVNASYKTPGFDINDLGFQQRADEIAQSAWFQVRDDQPGRFVRSVSVNFNQWAGWNFDGDRRFSGGNVNAHWVLVNNWSFGTGFNVNTAGDTDRGSRGGPIVRSNGNLNQWGYLSTDDRQALALSFDASWFNDRRGSWSWSAGPNLTWRPSAALAVTGGFSVSRNLTDSQWVENVASAAGTDYVFGRLNQTTVRLSGRVNYTITPNLTLQLYAQPFVSAAAYTDFRALADGRAERYADRYAPFAYGGDPDFNFRSFRTTNVLRWEYRPGSTLFVVWQQGRDDVAPLGSFRFGRDFGGTFDTPSTNVFLVKISRWINF
jgi:hypothetical protein